MIVKAMRAISASATATSLKGFARSDIHPPGSLGAHQGHSAVDRGAGGQNRRRSLLVESAACLR